MQNVSRVVRLGRENGRQTLSIPSDCAFDVDEVRLSKQGERLIVEPSRGSGLLRLLESLEPLSESLPDVDEGLPSLDEPAI